MSEKLKTKLTVAGLIVSIMLGLGGPFATFQLLQFKAVANDQRDDKQEQRMDRMDVRADVIQAELSLIRRTLERIDERTLEMQRQENRRYQP